MAIAWVQGSGGTSISSPLNITLTVGAGNALLACVGRNGFVAAGEGPAGVSDDKGNVWEYIGMSPSRRNTSTGQCQQLFVFIAMNCAAGSTVITAQDGNCELSATVDEYSGVAIATAYDQLTFASMLSSSVDSGNITIAGTQLLFLAAYADADTSTISATGGFTSRTYETHGPSGGSNGNSVQSFDKSASAGVYSSTISATGTPLNSTHVLLVSLSVSPIIHPNFVQRNYNALGNIVANTISVGYCYPNAAGNVLIIAARIYERANFTISDTQGNVWSLVYSNDGTFPNTNYFVFGYALNCKAGANVVTLVGTTGGNDVAMIAIVAEYYLPQAAYTGTSYRVENGGPFTQVSTGFVASPGNALLISCMIDQDLGGESPGPISVASGTRRFQANDPGDFNEYNGTVVLADQLAPTLNNYQETFDISPTTSGGLSAAIFGFTTTPSPSPPPPFRCVNVPSSGVMPTIEITRDLDADWDDSSTFVITQDDPLPFTLRGLVMRMSYNPD